MFKIQNIFLTIFTFISLITSYIFATVMNTTFVLPLYQSFNQRSNELSVFYDTNFDFIAYSPSEDQIDDLLNESSITSVFPYYLSSSVVSLNQSEYATFAAFSSSSSLETSQYNNERAIESLLIQPLNPIYLDTIAASNLNASLGDQVNLSLSGINLELTFTVAKIFLQDTLYIDQVDESNVIGSVYFPYTNAVRQSIENAVNAPLKFYAVMIDSNNLNSTENYLESYIPFGRMLTRDFFSTDVEYNAYVSDFISQNYDSEVTNKQDLLDDRLVFLDADGNLFDLRDENAGVLSISTIIYFAVVIVLGLAFFFIMLGMIGKVSIHAFLRQTIFFTSVPASIVTYGTFLYGFSIMSAAVDSDNFLNLAIFNAYFSPSIILPAGLFLLFIILTATSRLRNKVNVPPFNEKEFLSRFKVGPSQHWMFNDQNTTIPTIVNQNANNPTKASRKIQNGKLLYQVVFSSGEMMSFEE